MEEYKSNSNKYRNSLAQPAPVNKSELKPVADGHVKEKTFVEKIFSNIVHDSVSDIRRYIVDDVIIPAIVDGMYNVAIATVETIFGRSASSSLRRASTKSKISYGNMYESSYRDTSRSARSLGSGFDFSKITFSTRPKAEDVLRSMDDILEAGMPVSVADFCKLSNVDDWVYPYENYGWTDLSTTRVVRTLAGDYILTLPKPRPLPKRL